MAFTWYLLLAAAAALSLIEAGPLDRIVGGDDSEVGQFPYQVSVQMQDGFHFCGGSILNEHFILTAAHCVVDAVSLVTAPAEQVRVRVGSIRHAAAGKLVQLKRIIVHEDYGNFLNDLALLELEKPLVFTKNIRPIPLATEEVPSGGEVIVSGWGRLYNNGPIPHRLQWNTLSALSIEECNKKIDMGPSIICLAHTKDNGVCQGDSGGPAYYDGKLVGVAGFVIGGCGTTNPDGYAKVSYHLDWIQTHMQQSD